MSSFSPSCVYLAVWRDHIFSSIFFLNSILGSNHEALNLFPTRFIFFFRAENPESSFCVKLSTVVPARNLEINKESSIDTKMDTESEMLLFPLLSVKRVASK